VNLAPLTTELIDVLATLTDLEVGDGVAPMAGEPTTGDYPYLVVYDLSDIAEHDLGRWQPGHAIVLWQINAVGLTRVQAAMARDRVMGLLDPTLPVETDDVAVVGRVHTGGFGPEPDDSGRTWNAVLRVEAVVAAIGQGGLVIGGSGPNLDGGQNVAAAYTTTFAGQTTLVVVHNLGYQPNVHVLDTAGDEVEGDIVHDSATQLTITFSSAVTGTVYCS
jgi:hypothetical protein